MEEGVAYDAGSRGQCGERYNDAIGTANGTKVVNSYESKQAVMDRSVTV